jgi:hypothetical protein
MLLALVLFAPWRAARRAARRAALRAALWSVERALGWLLG